MASQNKRLQHTLQSQGCCTGADGAQRLWLSVERGPTVPQQQRHSIVCFPHSDQTHRTT
jgi:hypothetical protein